MNSSKRIKEELRKGRANNHKPKKSGGPRYSKQIIINLDGSNNDMLELQKRLEKNKEPISDKNILDWRRSKSTYYSDEENRHLFSKIDNKSRIYIVAHSDFFSNDVISGIHYNKLAEFLSKFLSNQELKRKSNSRRLRISLIICGSAKGKKSDLSDSFGAKLHNALGEYGLYTEIIARCTKVTLLSVASEGKRTLKEGKETKEMFYSLMAKTGFLSNNKARKEFDNMVSHREPGSKITFKWDELDRQIIVDSYFDDLKNRVLENITQALKFNNEHPGFLKIPRNKIQQIELTMKQFINDLPSIGTDDFIRALKEQKKLLEEIGIKNVSTLIGTYINKSNISLGEKTRTAGMTANVKISKELHPLFQKVLSEKPLREIISRDIDTVKATWFNNNLFIYILKNIENILQMQSLQRVVKGNVSLCDARQTVAHELCQLIGNNILSNDWGIESGGVTIESEKGKSRQVTNTMAAMLDRINEEKYEEKPDWEYTLKAMLAYASKASDSNKSLINKSMRPEKVKRFYDDCKEAHETFHSSVIHSFKI
jgi:Peptidase C80 family